MTAARGAAGVSPHDDSEILNTSLAIRHIANDTNHVVYDENRKCRRISSGAFSASSDDPDFGMSVDLEASLTKASQPLDAMVPPGFGAVSLRIEKIRELNLVVGFDPIPAGNVQGLPENPYHGQVWGVKTSKIRRKLHKIVEGWIVPLDEVALR